MSGRKAIVCALIALCAAMAFFEMTSFDLSWQDQLYDPETRAWVLSKSDRVLALIFYKLTKVVILIVWIGVMALALLGRPAPVRQRRRGLVVAAICLPLIPLIVVSLKNLTNMPCPYSMQRYGGSVPAVGLFERLDREAGAQKRQRCYPAGHASAGFALLSLVGVFLRRKNRQIWVGISLAIGWTMGGYKIAIGDHTIGHTIMSMLVAWFVVVLVNTIAGKLSCKETRCRTVVAP